MPALIDLSFDLAAPDCWTAVFFLTSNNLVNRRSDLFALGFLNVTEGTCNIGLLLIKLSVVETISASKIGL